MWNTLSGNVWRFEKMSTQQRGLHAIYAFSSLLPRPTGLRLLLSKIEQNSGSVLKLWCALAATYDCAQSLATQGDSTMLRPPRQPHERTRTWPLSCSPAPGGGTTLSTLLRTITTGTSCPRDIARSVHHGRCTLGEGVARAYGLYSDLADSAPRAQEES